MNDVPPKETLTQIGVRLANTYPKSALSIVIVLAGVLWQGGEQLWQVACYFTEAREAHAQSFQNEKDIKQTNAALQKIVETEKIRLEAAKVRAEEKAKSDALIEKLCETGKLKDPERCPRQLVVGGGIE
jgi:hypothetical protein